MSYLALKIKSNIIAIAIKAKPPTDELHLSALACLPWWSPLIICFRSNAVLNNNIYKFLKKEEED